MSILWSNRGHFYAPEVRPVLLTTNFVVDPANGNGLGVRSIKGQGIANVFMHTSATPGPGSNGLINPNPAAGNILVQFTDNFMRSLGGSLSLIPPVSGTPILVASAGVTTGVAYIIVSPGTTTYAGWVSLGMPPGVTPAAGVAFIAKITGTATGTGAVEVPAAGYSGIDHVETIGDPNLTLNPIPIGGSPNVGGFITLACLLDTTLTAPATGSVIALEFYLSQSSVAIAGQ